MSPTGKTTADVDAKPLLTAMAKRGIAVDTPSAEPEELAIESMRLSTQYTGQLYTAQLVTLKRNAMLLGDAKTIVSVDVDNHQVSFKFLPKAGPESIQPLQERLQQLVAFLFGKGWSVILEGNDSASRPTSPSRKLPKSKGVRRGKKARK